jgi:hypothetical protein
MRGVLGHAQGAEVGEEDVRLGRCLAPRRHLEHHAHPVDHRLLTGCRDVMRRREDADRAGRRRLPQPGADLALRATRKGRAVHVRRPPGHGGPGVDVLAHRVLQEPRRRQDRHLARVDLFRGHHAANAAEVVGVAVGVEHPRYRAVTTMLPVQGQRRRRGLRRDQGVDDDDTPPALHEADVGEVEPPHLVDPGHDLEQPLHRRERRLAPQAGVHRGGWVADEEAVRVVVPHHAAVAVPHHPGRERAQEPTAGIGGVLLVLHRQRLRELLERSGHRLRRRLLRRVHTRLLDRSAGRTSPTARAIPSSHG